MMAFPCGIPMLLPAACNWLAEKPAATNCSPNFAKVVEHKGIFVMSMVLAFGALGGVALLIMQVGTMFRAVYYGTLSTVFCVMSFRVLPENIAKPAFYMFLCSTLRLFFTGTLQAWYTGPNYNDGVEAYAKLSEQEKQTITVDDLYCIRDGPSFEVSYYQFVGNIVGAGAGTVGVFIFQRFIINWRVRPAFWITTVFQLFATCLELMILERWNHKLMGTDPLNKDHAWVDQLFFVVGAQAVDKIIEMLDFMPCNVLIGRLCPANLEATIFAVLAGSQNFGSTLARIFGAIFVELLGVNFNVAKMDCRNPAPLADWGIGISGLGIARIVGGIVLPALTIPMTFCLLPDKMLNDNYLDENEGVVETNVPLAALGTMPTLGTLPRGMTNVSAPTFVSMASITRSMNNSQVFL
jgi:hypothetical protein